MPSLLWDEGTSYDFFVSLYVLHWPAIFGLRPSWAAGVRSRLPAGQRDFLEQIHSFLPVPLSWLYFLPAEAKTTAGAINALAQLPAAERLPSLLITADTPIEVINALQNITLRQTWTSAEQEVLRAGLIRRGIKPRPSTTTNLCKAWIDLTATGEQYLEALQTYYEVFFQEEEARIRPSVYNALDHAKQRASEVTPQELLTELSHGVHFERAENDNQVILVPSYWASPLMFYFHLKPDRLMVLFAARPKTDDLTSGEIIPEDLVDRMKAIADPTRLRILRYLATGPLNPSELARRLRLRPPTVIHHLNALRLVGLVEITLHASGERGYGLRREALDQALSSLTEFLRTDHQNGA